MSLPPRFERIERGTGSSWASFGTPSRPALEQTAYFAVNFHGIRVLKGTYVYDCGDNRGTSPHIAPRAAMIAADFARVRVLATESIATPMVEGARTRTRAKDRQGRGQRGLWPEPSSKKMD